MSTIELLTRKYPSRRAELKRMILDQALNCFNIYGVEATTIDDIKKACDTSVGAIYHHFGSKEGILAQLYFIALDDKTEQRGTLLKAVSTPKAFIQAVIYSYIDWVVTYPELAKFQLVARYAVMNGPFKNELIERNQQRNKQIFLTLKQLMSEEKMSQLPTNLIFSLVVGAVENYTRAWLSQTVQHSPQYYREEFADAAWQSVEPYFSMS